MESPAAPSKTKLRRRGEAHQLCQEGGLQRGAAEDLSLRAEPGRKKLRYFVDSIRKEWEKTQKNVQEGVNDEKGGRRAA